MKYQPKKENRMPQYQANQMVDGDPIFMMDENNQPLFMLGCDFKVSFGVLNFYGAVTKAKKENKLSAKFRIRFPDNRKKVFDVSTKNPKSLEEYKNIIREALGYFLDSPWTEGTIAGEPKEIEFDENESMDSVMKKMDESGLFNIGIVEKH